MPPVESMATLEFSMAAETSSTDAQSFSYSKNVSASAEENDDIQSNNFVITAVEEAYSSAIVLGSSVAVTVARIILSLIASGLYRCKLERGQIIDEIQNAIRANNT